MTIRKLPQKIATCGVVLSIYAIISVWAFAQHSKTWKLTPQPLDLPHKTLNIVLGTSTAEHWAVDVVSLPGDAGRTQVSAGTVALDGPWIDSVKDLDSSRLRIVPGAVQIQGVSAEAGLAVCAAVPAGTDVRILMGDQLVASATTGLLVVDGTVLVRKPTLCSSILAVQRAILRSGPGKLE